MNEISSIALYQLLQTFMYSLLLRNDALSTFFQNSLKLIKVVLRPCFTNILSHRLSAKRGVEN